MKAILQCELYKLCFNKKNWLCIGLLILVSLCNCYRYRLMDKAYDRLQIESYEMESQMAEQRMTELKDRIDALPNTTVDREELVQAYEKERKDWQQTWIYAGNLISYYENRNSLSEEQYFALQLHHDAWILEGVEKGYTFNFTDAYTATDIQERMQRITYLQDHKIPLYHSPYTMNVTNYLTLAFEDGSILVFIGLLFFIFADLFVGEFETEGYKWTFTTPVSRTKILMAKLLLLIIGSFLLLLLALLLTCIVCLFQQGFGNLHYPILIRLGKFTTAASYIMKLFTLIINDLVFMLLLFAFCALIIKSFANLSLFIGVLCLIMIFVPSFFSIDQTMISAIPIFYHNASRILQEQTWITFYQAIPICLFTDSIMIAMSMYYIKKIDL